MRPSGRPLSSSTPTPPPLLPAGAAGDWRWPGVTILAPGAETLLAGAPLAVGGALAPTLGALGVVTFGFCAGIPGFCCCCPAAGVPAGDAAGRLFGSFGEPEGVEGEGGVMRDIGAILNSS